MRKLEAPIKNVFRSFTAAIITVINMKSDFTKFLLAEYLGCMGIVNCKFGPTVTTYSLLYRPDLLNLGPLCYTLSPQVLSFTLIVINLGA